MIWFDDRLTWDPQEFDNITEITLPSSKLWVKTYYKFKIYKILEKHHSNKLFSVKDFYNCKSCL